MISRSWTYFRSVSTISRIILFRAVSCAFTGVGTEGTSVVRESVESWDDNIAGGESGGSTNWSSDSRSTSTITVLMT